ncbi:unnamed protein product [Strongylus vulgaris]|uniref:Uncharacterized protein n=1 Tax=Strongylus vulgaris TaxID=40348 RepID=A0A3P7KPD6_STRVU|nr:unnamed protein product [Strongylus vulgaris]
MIPGRICRQLPSILDERVNSRLASLPQTIGVTQILNLFGEALLGIGGETPSAQYCETYCRANASIAASQPPASETSAALPSAPPASAPVDVSSGQASEVAKAPYKQRHAAGRGTPLHFLKNNKACATTLRTSTHSARPVVHAAPSRRKMPFRRGGEQEPAPSAPSEPSPSDLCAKCPGATGGAEGSMQQFLRLLGNQLDKSKVDDLYLSLQLLNTQASSNDFTIDLNGEFSPNAQGGTPFGAFPISFPSPYDNKMAEIILSDYTINTLLYWLHK